MPTPEGWIALLIVIGSIVAFSLVCVAVSLLLEFRKRRRDAEAAADAAMSSLPWWIRRRRRRL